MHAIIPGVLYQRGDFSHADVDRKRHTLSTLGINTVWALYGHYDADISDIVRYIHCPIPDGKRVDYEQAQGIAAEVAQRLSSGGRAITMCHAGRNRSGLASAMIVRWLLRVSGAEAMAIVRRGRPRALANDHFETYLNGLGAP